MLKTIEKIKYIEQSEWEEIGDRLYGAYPKKWKFQCANCGNVQSGEDFKKLIDDKILPADFEIHRYVYFACIGRYDTRIKKVGTLGNKIKPCDYTLGGFFNLSKLCVWIDDKKKVYVFDFADDWSGMFDSEGNYLKP